MEMEQTTAKDNLIPPNICIKKRRFSLVELFM
jgi:hypothetical protein